MPDTDPVADEPTVTVTVLADGPYDVSGPVRIVGADGRPLRAGERFYLCRCGQSNTKPYCDSTHKKIGFSDPGLGPQRRRKAGDGS